MEVFATTADRMAYLTNPSRYAGLIVSDLETEKAYMLNATTDSWIAISCSEECICGIYTGNL